MIKNVIWFTNMKGTIGIALTENEVGEKKAYISAVSGLDQELDAVHVAQNGSKLLPSMVKEILNHLDPEYQKQANLLLKMAGQEMKDLALIRDLYNMLMDVIPYPIMGGTDLNQKSLDLLDEAKRRLG